MEKHFLFCPNCGQHITMLLDLSVSSLMYTEDYEVCCHPIEVRYTVSGNRVVEFDAQRANS